MSKYNVGDVIKLRDDLEVGKKYNKVGFHSRMKEMQNVPIKITNIDIDEDYETEYNWYINDEMIEGLWEECKEKQVTMKYKIGDRFRYKDEYNTYKIIRCDEEVGKYITVEEKQVGSRVFDVCEEKNMFLEECKEKQDKLKLIDVLNMIAKGELKEGTKVKWDVFEYTYREDEFADECLERRDSDNKIVDILEDMYLRHLTAEVELIEPPCEHEWKDIETHRMGEGRIRRNRRCNKCGLEEETEDNHFADVGKMAEPTDNTTEKIYELKDWYELPDGLTSEEKMQIIWNKLNEVIRKINKE